MHKRLKYVKNVGALAALIGGLFLAKHASAGICQGDSGTSWNLLIENACSGRANFSGGNQGQSNAFVYAFLKSGFSASNQGYDHSTSLGTACQVTDTGAGTTENTGCSTGTRWAYQVSY